jgi:hypothetical protein
MQNGQSKMSTTHSRSQNVCLPIHCHATFLDLNFNEGSHFSDDPDQKLMFVCFAIYLAIIGAFINTCLLDLGFTLNQVQSARLCEQYFNIAWKDAGH